LARGSQRLLPQVRLPWESGLIHPAGTVDRTALRWHVEVWDLWFLLWGILLAAAAIGYRRRVTGARV
jgi:hypothetical protein